MGQPAVETLFYFVTLEVWNSTGLMDPVGDGRIMVAGF